MNEKQLERGGALKTFLKEAKYATILVVAFLLARWWLQKNALLTAQQATIFYYGGIPLGFLLWRAVKRLSKRQQEKMPPT